MAQDKILPGYEQSVGAKLFAIVDHAGPASYNSTTGDIYPASALGRGGFDKVDGGLTISGIYSIQVRYPVGYQGNGVPNVVLRWTYAAIVGNGVNSVVIATAGTGQTPGNYTATASTGAATIAYTIAAGGTLTVVTITNPGSGYVTAPTFTIAAGGTPGTVTATIGSISGLAVATGTNLSNEFVRLGAWMY